jgi:hypothetical protein
MSFIIPSWFSVEKGWINFVKKMERTDIVCITQFDDASKIFGSSDDKGGGKLFLKDMNYNGDCLFNGSLSTLSKYDVFVDGITALLIN